MLLEKACYSGGINRFQGHRSPSWIRKAVVRRMFISPASIFWRFRVAISALSASASWVRPFRTRSRRTLAPKTLILAHSFRAKATTYYVVQSKNVERYIYREKVFGFFLALGYEQEIKGHWNERLKWISTGQEANGVMFLHASRRRLAARSQLLLATIPFR